MIRAGLIALAFVTLAGCGESPRAAEYRQYRAERVVARICRDGTEIWRWRDRYYVSDSRQWPDAQIGGSLEAICQ